MRMNIRDRRVRLRMSQTALYRDRLGLTQSLGSKLEHWEPWDPRPVSPTTLARVLAELGRLEQAVAQLQARAAVHDLAALIGLSILNSTGVHA